MSSGLRATAAALVTSSSGTEVLSGTNADGSPVSWFEANWPFGSWAIFLFGSGVLVGRIRKRDQHWYGWLAMVAYCLHQSEEHAYDLRGWRYSFVPSLNAGPIADFYLDACKAAYEASTPDEAVSCPLDPKITLYVNTILIWIGFGGCMVAAELVPSRFLLAGSLNWGTAVVNGIMGHILPAVVTQSYNPGVVQSLFMVPLGIRLVLRSGRPGLCLFNGVVTHLLLVVGINLVFRLHTDEALTFSVLMLVAALPVPLGLSDAFSSKPGEKEH